VETFFQHFEERTGYDKEIAQQIIRIISGYLAKNYKKEFVIIIQYFLSQTFDRPGNIDLEWHYKKQTV
jgi:hypothetical protein